MTRDTTIIKVVSSFGENLVHFIVGLMFIAGGGWIVRYSLHTEPHSDKLLYRDRSRDSRRRDHADDPAQVFKQIIVVVQGIPVLGTMLGGRRAGEQPPAGGSPS
jgi:hypothetical protein